MADLNTQSSQGFTTPLSTNDAPPAKPPVAAQSPSQTAIAPSTQAATTTTSQAQPATDKAAGEPQLVTAAGSGGKEKGNSRKVIATILGIILLIAGVATGVYLIGQQQEIRIGAWDCQTYVFEVNQGGVVAAINGSTRNEPSQKANVSINGQLVATCNVPALAAGDAAQICTVTVPSSGNFSWEVVGTKDCEDSGSYQATPTPTPIPTSSPTAYKPPDFPACPQGYKLLDTFEDFLRRDTDPISRSHTLSFSESSTILLDGWVKEGHPEKGCPGDPSCNQNQDHEDVIIELDGNAIAVYEDSEHGPEENAWFPFTTPITNVSLGTHTLTFRHTRHGSGPQSVDYKFSLCDSSTPTTPTVTPTPPPIGAACLNVKAYDINWTLLSSSDLSSLQGGGIVRFAVAGTTSQNSFDKARFMINGILRPEVSAQKPGSEEFYDEYIIPNGVTGFTVSAQIHHTSLGWF